MSYLQAILGLLRGAASRAYGSIGGQDNHLVLHSSSPASASASRATGAKTRSWFHLKPVSPSPSRPFNAKEAALASSAIAPAARSEEQR